MKKIKRTLLVTLVVFIVSCAVIFSTLKQASSQKMKIYTGAHNFTWVHPSFDKQKKTVFIIAGNEGTEMFDFMAPFYLFNATGKANVYIIAEKKTPVLLVNSLFILPHFSYAEMDSLQIIPDVIVIPNQTLNFKVPQKPSLIKWIKSKYTGSNIILSICDGSATAAATGIFNGKLLTTHASDFNTLKKQFPAPLWVQDIGVTERDNLFSTAGVSNAADGSLMVIKKLFGEEEMLRVLQKIKYPHSDINIQHRSIAVNTGNIIRVASKIVLRKNYKMGVLLDDGIDEFALASILDTYVRTYPKALNSFTLNASNITSRYGLTIYPTGDLQKDKIDELHVLGSRDSGLDLKAFEKVNIIFYDREKQYPIDVCLGRIESLYGKKFKDCVKLMLDYN